MRYAQSQAGGSTTSLPKSSPFVGPMESSESIPQALADRSRSAVGGKAGGASNSSFLTGVLHKKRRKRNQGHARRFFSLDFTSSTLSYYRKHQYSSALRGAIPLSLAAVGANEETREISIDSGAEIWQLRASNAKDFQMWRDALDRASRTATAISSPTLQIKDSPYQNIATHVSNADEDNEWARVEGLVGKIVGTRDAVRRLAQDTDPKYSSTAGLGLTRVNDSLSPTPSETESGDYFPDDRAQEKKAFWKRKASTSGGQSPSGMFRRSVSAQVGVASPGALPPVPPLPANVSSNGSLSVPKGSRRQSSLPSSHEEGVHDNCMALLRDLDTVVREFSDLIAQSKQRSQPPSHATASSLSNPPTSSSTPPTATAPNPSSSPSAATATTPKTSVTTKTRTANPNPHPTTAAAPNAPASPSTPRPPSSPRNQPLWPHYPSNL
jgi:hypothetical protein